MGFTDIYPLVNIQKTMENHHVFDGKSTISMTIFNSILYVYQRVATKHGQMTITTEINGPFVGSLWARTDCCSVEWWIGHAMNLSDKTCV
jgi:hypothetical protein